MNALEMLSDEYEHQYQRLEKAMIELFKYNNLLNNEYLIRKFEVDINKPNYYLLQYVVIQRENSIKNQYVQNDKNDRKQYHLILTEILNKFNHKLWNFDQSQLLIRPYFPSEFKTILIKLPKINVSDVKQCIRVINNKNSEIYFDENVYQADKSYVKLTVEFQIEEEADNTFTYLMENKQKFQIDSVMMQQTDHLNQFHKQLNQKKCQMLAKGKQQIQNNIQNEKETEKRTQFQKTTNQQQHNNNNNNNNKNYDYEKKNNYKYKQYNQQQYGQKNNEEMQQFHLLSKNNNSMISKQTNGQNQFNVNDFPTLNQKQS